MDLVSLPTTGSLSPSAPQPRDALRYPTIEQCLRDGIAEPEGDKIDPIRLLPVGQAILEEGKQRRLQQVADAHTMIGPELGAQWCHLESIAIQAAGFYLGHGKFPQDSIETRNPPKQ